MSHVQVREVPGDLIQAPNEYGVQVIVQQLNALAVKPHGLSATIAKAWPYADVYGRRKQQGHMNLAVASDRAVPGTISVSEPPSTRTEACEAPTGSVPHSLPLPTVVGIFGQYEMGKPLKYDYTCFMKKEIASGEYTVPEPDNSQNRERWFRQGLSELAEFMCTQRFESVAFPDQIGCGLAGGNWETYKRMIVVDFKTLLEQRCEHDVTVYIVHIPTPKRPAPDSGNFIEVMMTGSRNWTRPVDAFMLDMVARNPEFANVNAQIRLHHGNARGADTLCDSFARRRGWTVQRYVPDWDGWRRRGNAAAAGVVRNAEMVNASQPEYVIGFVQPVSRGTWHALKCIQKYASEANTRLKEVTIVSEDAHGAITTRVYTHEQYLAAHLDD